MAKTPRDIGKHMKRRPRSALDRAKANFAAPPGRRVRDHQAEEMAKMMEYFEREEQAMLDFLYEPLEPPNSAPPRAKGTKA
jgi:hypothetical protein